MFAVILQAEEALAAAAEFGGQAARLRTQVEAEQRLVGLLAGLRAAEQVAGAELQVCCVSGCRPQAA